MASATASLPLRAQQRRGRTFVALAAVAWSSAGILQRELSVDIGTQVAGRALFAVLGLLAYVAVAERGAVLRAFHAVGRAGLAVAALMAVSSGSFIIALNHASVANILFMQALAPVFGMLRGEPVSRRTWVAMAVAIGGVVLMVGGPGRPQALGFGLSLLMTVSFAGTLVITRHRRDGSMAPATCLSQVLVFACAAPFAHPSQVGSSDLVLLVSLGVGQIGLGFVFLTIGGRLIPAAEGAPITPLGGVLGPLGGWRRPSRAAGGHARS